MMYQRREGFAFDRDWQTFFSMALTLQPNRSCRHVIVRKRLAKLEYRSAELFMWLQLIRMDSTYRLSWPSLQGRQRGSVQKTSDVSQDSSFGLTSNPNRSIPGSDDYPSE